MQFICVCIIIERPRFLGYFVYLNSIYCSAMSGAALPRFNVSLQYQPIVRRHVSHQSRLTLWLHGSAARLSSHGNSPTKEYSEQPSHQGSSHPGTESGSPATQAEFLIVCFTCKPAHREVNRYGIGKLIRGRTDHPGPSMLASAQGRTLSKIQDHHVCITIYCYPAQLIAMIDLCPITSVASPSSGVTGYRQVDTSV